MSSRKLQRKTLAMDKLVRMQQHLESCEDLSREHSRFYHTLHFKKNPKSDGFTQVYSEQESDKSFIGEWCHNGDSASIISSMGEVNGGSLLDAGCCDGFFSFMFRSLGASVTSLDMCDRWPRNLYASLLEMEDKFIHRNIYDCSSMSLAGHTFDYVWCQDVLVHLMHPALAIQNLRQVCKKKIFLGIDRVQIKEQSQIEYFYPITSKVWGDQSLIEKNVCFATGAKRYPYGFTADFILSLLKMLGFKNCRLKFSYSAEGKNTMKNCGHRIIDIIEAEVDNEHQPFPIDTDFILASHAKEKT